MNPESASRILSCLLRELPLLLARRGCPPAKPRHTPLSNEKAGLMVLTHSNKQTICYKPQMQLWLTFNTEITFKMGGFTAQTVKKLNSEPSFNHVPRSTLRDNAGYQPLKALSVGKRSFNRYSSSYIRAQ